MKLLLPDAGLAVAPGTIEANINGLVGDITAVPWGCVIDTIGPCANLAGWTAQMEANRVTVNAYLTGLAFADTYPGCKVINLDPIVGVGTCGAPSGGVCLNPTYDIGDGIHPNGGGNYAEAQAEFNVLLDGGFL